MTVVSYIILGLIAVIIGVLAVSFVWLISRNMQQGREVREQLAERIRGLRMSKMLSALGLDFNGYLHKVPLHRISESMHNCETCPTTAQCDQVLKQESVTPQEIDFCPNQNCLGKFVELDKTPT